MYSTRNQTNIETQSTIPLIVDLDGTLSQVDTMHEAILGLISREPLKLFKLFEWLRGGKARFKDELANESLIDTATLPLRKSVLEHIETAKADGRPVLLVSASSQRQVSAIADHLDLFDEAVGSTPDRNLSGTQKKQWLVDRFGDGGFDYIGDSTADLDVWPSARQVLTAGAAPATRLKADAISTKVVHLDAAKSHTGKASIYLKAMRPHQWLKNLLVFVPALAAHDGTALLLAAFAFVSFSLAASSIYLINDMLDLDADRRHPRKRLRPFAAGTIPVLHGLVQAAILFFTAMTIAALTSKMLLLVMVAYVILTFAYSLLLKRKLMVDIWTLATLYTVRIVAGGAATGVALSEWLLAFSMFLFLSLAAVKRLSELADLKNRGMTEIDGRGYNASDLPVILGVVLSAGYCSVVILALYISSANVATLYGEPRLLWLVCMFLLYWISRATMTSFRGEMDDDPIVYAIKDRVSLFIFALCALIFISSAQL